MKEEDINAMAFRALILHVKNSGGRLVIEDKGETIFETLRVSWGSGAIVLHLELPEGSMSVMQ